MHDGPQRELIDKVRQACLEDPALDAALMYGSFAQGTADEHSDIEFWLFFARPQPDPAAWINRVSPARYVLLNEFGAHVAIFPGLIRGEFHFAGTADMAAVAAWPAAPVVPLVDRRAALPQPAAPIDMSADICGRFANWLLLAHHVGRRGETLRRRDALAHAQRHLLWMARLASGRTGHWLTPSRQAEAELDLALVARFDRTHEDVRAAWHLGRDLWHRLDPNPPRDLIEDLDRAIGRP
ncbi:nucleotidyltransferase domain-containing protein [Actinoplanes sp. N902-109]|uniref:nucleotidyltransferase domain-containing protein n=1 Tax=Actinoplanes sp. (strain N902-109) TaxID=649831 RepID=UPI00032945E5|nr:nucleotidyltransferase domain-containing protein [Actinoplanes sp. N902-109]AGL15320.1 LinF [Actinoplanes sp. N902-109]